MKYVINESAFSNGVAIKQKNPHTIEFIAILQEANKKNRNGRIYPKEVLEQGINSPYLRERLATNTCYGEAGHPADTSVQRQMTIDQRNIAFLIHELWWEGDLLKGHCETADTAVGRDMMGLIEQGSKVAFSLRAQGNVHRDPVTGDQIVDPGIQICCWDWVVNPSHSVAYIENICEETIKSFCHGAMTLTEAADFYSEGQLIDVDAKSLYESIDYTKKYNTQFKKLSEMYRPAVDDEVISMNENETIIHSGNVEKKVLTEDFLVKDIRNRLIGLFEEREPTKKELEKIEHSREQKSIEKEVEEDSKLSPDDYAEKVINDVKKASKKEC